MINKNILGIAGSIGLIAAGVYLKGCNYSEVDNIKEHATNTLANAGFKIVGYEGYQIGDMFQTPGGEVWYEMIKTNDNNVLYHCFISKWGNEYHIYSIKALNAISSIEK